MSIIAGAGIKHMKKSILIILLISSPYCLSFWHSFFPDQLMVQPTAASGQQATIMLSPFGNNNSQGRSLKSNFESSIAHQFVHALAQELETNFPTIRIRMSHEKTDCITPLQIASMANCLPVDLFIQFQFYSEHESKICIYHCSNNNDFLCKCWDLSWCQAGQAYLINKKNSAAWAQKIANVLSSADNSKWFSVVGPYAIPLKPMVGIIAPSLLIEIGLANDDDWKQMIAPITESLKPIIHEIISTVKQETHE